MKTNYEVIVVGGGIAGYSAALTLKSLNIDFLWIGDSLFGDKIYKAEHVRNYPAFSGDGKAFFAALKEQSKREGISLLEKRVTAIYAGEPFTVAAGQDEFTAKAVILAVGVGAKERLIGEKEFLGRGVSYCAVCDGALYRGKKIAVMIAGDREREEVEYLAGFASKVEAFCESGTTFHAQNITVRKDKPLKIEGGRRVETLVTDTGSEQIDGVFLLGYAVPFESLVGGLKTDGKRVPVDREMKTNLAGLYAAGDVTGTPYQYAKAAGEGLVAAYSAAAFVRRGR